MSWPAYLEIVSSALKAFNKGICSLRSTKCKKRLFILRALNHIYIVYISPISNTTKNNRFNNFTAFVIKKENSTVKNTHKIIRTTQSGQRLTYRIKYDIKMVVINIAI